MGPYRSTGCLLEQVKRKTKQKTQGWMVEINVLLTAMVISGWPVLLVEETAVPGGNHRPMVSH